MHLSEIMTAASIVAAIEEGEVWTPEWRRGFLRALANGGPAPRFFGDSRNSLRAIAERALNEGGPVPAEAKFQRISANALQECLIHCEEDEARHKTKDLDKPGTPHAKREQKRIAVSRFGVRIERLIVIGALDLQGFRLGRPFALVDCRFSRTLSLGDAHLGSIDLSSSVFDARLEDGASEDGRLAGVFMPSVRIDGAAQLRNVEADFIEFSSAVIGGIADLSEARVRWWADDPEIPALTSKSTDQDAVSFNGAKAGHVVLRKARIHGTLDLIELKAGSIELDRARIAAFVDADGNRGRAIDARSLRLDSRLDLGNRAEIEIAEHPASKSPGKATASQSAVDAQTLIFGAVWLNSAEIGGDIRAHGVQFVRGLSEKTVKELDKRSRTATSRDERELTRAIVLRNSRINGSILFGDRNVLIRQETRNREKGGAQNLLRSESGGERLKKTVKMSCDGEIDIRNATIDGDARFVGCKFENCVRNREVVLDLRMSDIGRMLAFTQMDPDSEGEIDLRDAHARVYRDDFDQAGSIALFEPRRWIYKCFTWALAAVFAVADLLVTLATLRFVAADYGDLLRRLDVRTIIAERLDELSSQRRPWPRRLFFVLAGFRYLSFPVRGEIGGDDTGDTEKMPILDGQRIRWLLHQPRKWLFERFQPQPFVQCAEVLRDLGYDRQAHAVLLRREKQALHSDAVGPLEKMVRLFLITLCGQGHQMVLLFVWALMLFSVGLMFNTVAINANLVRPTSDEVIVSENYRFRGIIPADYSSLNAIPFTFKRLAPIPPMAGTNEWAACNWRQIRIAVESKFEGACVPRACQVAEEKRSQAGADQRCYQLPLYSYDDRRRGNDGRADIDTAPFQRADAVRRHIECSIEDSQRPTFGRGGDSKVTIKTGVYADVLCASPNIRKVLASIDHATGLDLVVGVNKFISNGRVTWINMFLVWMGWIMSIIIATYATGVLKRRE